MPYTLRDAAIRGMISRARRNGLADSNLHDAAASIARALPFAHGRLHPDCAAVCGSTSSVTNHPWPGLSWPCGTFRSEPMILLPLAALWWPAGFDGPGVSF